MSEFQYLKSIFERTGPVAEDFQNCHKLVFRLGDFGISFCFYGKDDHLGQVGLHRPEILQELITSENFAKLFRNI